MQFTEIGNGHIDNAKYIDVVMPMYNLIEYSNNYSKSSGRSCHYYMDEPSDNIANSESFQLKVRIKENASDNDNNKMLK